MPRNTKWNKISGAEDNAPFGNINMAQPVDRAAGDMVSTFRFQFYKHDDRCGGPGPEGPQDWASWNVYTCNEPAVIPHTTLSFFDFDGGIMFEDEEGPCVPSPPLPTAISWLRAGRLGSPGRSAARSSHHRSPSPPRLPQA